MTWRDRYPDQVTCVRCLEIKDQMLVDRLLWCEECRGRARNRAAWWGWLFGMIFGAIVALYVWVFIQPDPQFVITGWIATVLAAVWIGSKIAREIAYGVMRFKNARAVDAVPPEGTA